MTKYFARINHSCSPNVIWSWVAGAYNVKEIRAVRDIEPGEELCANYIDSFEVNRLSHVIFDTRSCFVNYIYLLSGHVVKLRGEASETEEMELHVHMSNLFSGS